MQMTQKLYSIPSLCLLASIFTLGSAAYLPPRGLAKQIKELENLEDEFLTTLEKIVTLRDSLGISSTEDYENEENAPSSTSPFTPEESFTNGNYRRKSENQESTSAKNTTNEPKSETTLSYSSEESSQSEKMTARIKWLFDFTPTEDPVTTSDPNSLEDFSTSSTLLKTEEFTGTSETKMTTKATAISDEPTTFINLDNTSQDDIISTTVVNDFTDDEDSFESTNNRSFSVISNGDYENIDTTTAFSTIDDSESTRIHQKSAKSPRERRDLRDSEKLTTVAHKISSIDDASEESPVATPATLADEITTVLSTISAKEPTTSKSDETTTNSPENETTTSESDETTTNLPENETTTSESDETTTNSPENETTTSKSDETTTNPPVNETTTSESDETTTNPPENETTTSKSDEQTAKTPRERRDSSGLEEVTTVADEISSIDDALGKSPVTIPGTVADEITTVLSAIPAEEPETSKPDEQTTKLVEVEPTTSEIDEQTTKLVEVEPTTSEIDEQTTKLVEVEPTTSEIDEQTTELVEVEPTTSKIDEQTAELVEVETTTSKIDEETTQSTTSVIPELEENPTEATDPSAEDIIRQIIPPGFFEGIIQQVTTMVLKAKPLFTWIKRQIATNKVLSRSTFLNSLLS